MAGINDTERFIVLRIIDANANRCAEGLRVVEEIARFSLEDASLTERLKEIRHEVRGAVARIAAGALAHRDSAADIGSSSATVSELTRGSLGAVARANFARAEEALRVLEEFGKLVDESGATLLKSLRFKLYSIEGDFFGTSGTFARVPSAPFLYAILDRGLVGDADVPAVAAAFVAGGVDMIQYRAKNIGEAQKRRDIVSILAAVREAQVPVLVNDDVELAREAGAHGVHVGACDTPPAEARSLLGYGRIVGVTVETLDGLDRVPLDAVDYIAVGAVFPSPTKPDAPIVGLEFVRRVRGRTPAPLVAIGGIGPSNAREVLEAGADGIAVVSALLAGDVKRNCFTLKEIIGTNLQRRKG
jgi:thiamine-phosphate pyrophosphorylase